MSKINLHEMFEARMNEVAEKYQDSGCIVNQPIIENARTRWAAKDYKAGYTAALNDLQGKVDRLVEALMWIEENYANDIVLTNTEYNHKSAMTYRKVYQAIAEFKNGGPK